MALNVCNIFHDFYDNSALQIRSNLLFSLNLSVTRVLKSKLCLVSKTICHHTDVKTFSNYIENGENQFRQIAEISARKTLKNLPIRKIKPPQKFSARYLVWFFFFFFLSIQSFLAISFLISAVMRIWTFFYGICAIIIILLLLFP